MSQAILNWIWIALFISISVVRKYHEYKAGRRSSVKDTPFVEAGMMILWGVAVGIVPFFYIFSDWIGFADYAFKIPLALNILGIALFLFAIWLLHRSHADLGEMWSPAVEPGASKQLRSEGVFKHIRHPMYAAHTLWGIAQLLMLPNYLAGLLPFVLMIILFEIRVPREERAMLEEFGDEYRAYMKRTGRIIPRFGQ